MTTQFRPGDFVRLRNCATGPVGVVSDLQPLKSASVEVKWADSATASRTQKHKPEDLQLATGKLPTEALALKHRLSLPETS